MIENNSQSNQAFCSAVIVAGGSSVRFGADKLFADLMGKPVLVHSIEALACCELIQEIVLVVRNGILAEAQKLAERYGRGKVSALVPGGATRLESALAGVAAVSARAELIGIHDGARPLATQDLIASAFEAAQLYGAAAPAVGVKDTIKIAADRFVCSTPDRQNLLAVQTPQCFRAGLIKEALAHAMKALPAVTDDCAAVEALGERVYLSLGSEENIKITSPVDLMLAEVILRRRQA